MDGKMSFGSDFYIDDLLHSQENKFCTYSTANIFVTTFNVNGKSPPDYLGQWLHFDYENRPDFIVIGLQEMDLALGTYVTDNASRQHEWLFVLQRSIPNTYIQVECVRLIGIFMVIYRFESSPFKIADVQTGIVPTGFLKFGNKGGVGVSMTINDSSYCFINSHLAAGNAELSRRNQDFRDISQMKFADGKTIYDHDAVIWLGDLNYRLSTSMNYEEVVRECNNNNISKLFSFDQLREQQRLKTAFNQFHELTPSFRPTYKFDVGTSTWDTSEKRRVPAWCDRILYWVKDKHVQLKQTEYISKELVTFSDHKPVCGLFQASIRLVDKKRRNMVYDELLRETDRKTNDLLPSITVSATDIAFGSVFFKQPAIRTLTIANNGLTATRFHFANKHQSADLPENWLTLTPKSSFIDIGDTVEVTLQVVVDNDEAWKVEEPTELNCILVIRLDKGRDYFLVVSAKYEPCCFGSSIEKMLAKEEKPGEALLIDFGEPSGAPSTNGVPPQFWHLVQTLRSIGLDKISFSSPFSDDCFFKIRDYLDKGLYNQLDSVAKESRENHATLYSTLHLLLRSLKRPLLSTVPIAQNSATEGEVNLHFVRSVPSPNKELFNYLVIFFRELDRAKHLGTDQLEMIVGSVFRNLQKTHNVMALRFIRWCITGKMFNLFGGAQKKFSDLLSQVTPEQTAEPHSTAEGTEEENKTSEAKEENPQPSTPVNTGYFAETFKNYAKIASDNISVAQKIATENLVVAQKIASDNLVIAQKNAQQLGNMVSQNLDNTFLGDLNKEQQKFKEEIEAKKEIKTESYPWARLPNEEEVKVQVLHLSKDSSIFLHDAPDFDEDVGVERTERMAKLFLEFDKDLLPIRYELVPKKITEEKFWRNYLYRVTLICKAVGNNTPKPKESVPHVNTETNFESPKEEVKETEEKKPESEKKDQSNSEEDWESEFLNEMADYEVVKASKPDEQWNKELDELLKSCNEDSAESTPTE